MPSPAAASPPSAPRGNQPINYSRFDHIGSSDEDDESPRSRPRINPPQPPADVRDDLEDYFRRLDERRSDRDGPDANVSDAASASVERFTDAQIAQLKSFKHEHNEAASSSSAHSECAICLSEFEVGETLTALPCAAAHAFHVDCVKSALSRSIYCPLCRVDVRALTVATAKTDAVDHPEAPPLTPRQLGFTRDGGMIQRYDPNPPAELQRPAYIPPHQANRAELVEILYPNHGVARVWRLPRELYESVQDTG
eukprot:scaffold4839_cov136-Isochrysis_galbana.AAC.3